MFKKFLILPLLIALFVCPPAFAFERITDATATPQQTFTEGDRPTNIPATRVRAVWLNGIQEELANVVEGRGLTLNAADNTQLKTAIDGQVNEHAALTAPHSATSAGTASRLVIRDASGRAQVAAPAAAADIARKDTVDTHANLTSPHSATSAATASRLVLRDAAGRAAFAPGAAAGDAVVLSQFAASKAANGYELSPSGIIRQWGYYAGAASKGSISFASSGINFPTACVNVQFTPIYDKDGGFGGAYIVQLDALPTTSGFAFNSSAEDLGTDDFMLGPIPFFWFAVGY